MTEPTSGMRDGPVLFDPRVVRVSTERAIAALENAVSELAVMLPEPKRAPLGQEEALAGAVGAVADWLSSVLPMDPTIG